MKYILSLCFLFGVLTAEDRPLLDSLKEHIHFHPDQENVVGYIYIGDQKNTINQGTWLYVKQALDYYKKVKPAFILMELNTPGGEVYSAQKISDALKEMDSQYGIPIVAYINNWAISAGAMLAYSSRYIAVAKDAAMGAAEPIIQTTEGTTTASEKVNSALRADFANRANYFGRNEVIAEAMVDKDMIVVMREGKIIKLNSDKQIIDQGSQPDLVISPKGKLLTLNAREIMEYGVGNILVEPYKVEPITAKEKEAGRFSASKERLFQTPFFKDIPKAVIVQYLPDWKTTFFTFLASPIVSSLLMMGLLIGFYIEMSTPGFGVAGAVSLICLGLILLSSFSLEAMGSLEMIIFFLGIAIILIDLFLLPTFGILGVIGVLFVVFGLFAMLLPGVENVHYEFDTKTLNAAGEYVLNRLAWLSTGFILSVVAIVVLAQKVFPKLAPYSRFVLSGSEQEAKEGFVAGIRQEELPSVGAIGIAETNLKPAGTVLIYHAHLQALSDGNFIDKGTPIEVIRIEGSTIIVRERGEKK